MPKTSQKVNHIFVVVLLCATKYIIQCIQVPPLWITSSYVKADTRVIVSVESDQTTNIPITTITYSSAFALPPRIVYGIQNYQSIDSLNIQSFFITRTSLLSTSFSIKVVLGRGTTIQKLRIRYLAIDSLFPHPVNSYDNIPVTYGATVFPNFTVNSSTIVSYLNVINFTKLSTGFGFAYKNFSYPLSNNKVLLFITSFDQDGSDDQNLAKPNPLTLILNTAILTNQTFQINMTHGVKAKIFQLNFSVLIFDQASVESSGLYLLVYEKFTFTSDGGFTAVPQQFLSNLIVGFIQYTTKKTFTTLGFNINFQNNSNGIFGIVMPKITVSTKGICPNILATVTYNVFYMKTWICPNGTFFNKSSDLCTCNIPNCTICQSLLVCSQCDSGFNLNQNAIINLQCTFCLVSNCIICPNPSLCQKCDQSNGYFLSPLNSSQCILCNIPYCINCSSLSACHECDGSSNYFVNPLNNSQDACIPCSIPNCLQCQSLIKCLQCDQIALYFLDENSSSPIYGTCYYCSVQNCVRCSNIDQCQLCDENNGYFLNGSNKRCQLCTIPNCFLCLNLTQCLICNQSDGYFYNLSSVSLTQQCAQCSLPSCLQCSALDSCGTCDQLNGYFLNQTDFHCYLCEVQNCIECLNLTSCGKCNQAGNYFLNGGNSTSTNSSDQCVQCVLSQCVRCKKIYQCQVCNESNAYFLNTSSSQCQLCLLDQCLVCKSLTTCLICNSSNMYSLDSTTGKCVNQSICMDGIFAPHQEQCDDGNNQNGDGCTIYCQVENQFTCQPSSNVGEFHSICFYQGQFYFDVVFIQKKDNQNQIQIRFEIGPTQAQFWMSVNFQDIIKISDMEGFDNYQIVINNDGTVSVFLNYNTDIHNKNITIQIDPSLSGKQALSRYQAFNKTFPVLPTDNQAAFFYDQNAYSMANITNVMSFVVGGLSLLVFIVGIFGYKLIGIQMMGVIQISYLSLISLSPVNPSFKALSNLWLVNGVNYFYFTKEYLKDVHSPVQAKSMFMSSQFIKNYNLTMIIILTPIAIGLSYMILSLLRSKSSLRLGKKIICEYGFDGIMFSLYIISFSFSLQVLYGVKNMDQSGKISIFICILMLILIIVYFVLIVCVPQNFGQFVNSFRSYEYLQDQNKFRCIQNKDRFWYNLLMIQRFLLGSCLVFMLNIKLCLLMPISVFVLEGLWLFMRRPYKQLRHNIRFGANLLICVIIQIIYLVQQMIPTQTSNKQHAWFLVPIIVCALLLVCVIYSAVFLVYQFKNRNNVDLGRQYIQQMSKTETNAQLKAQPQAQVNRKNSTQQMVENKQITKRSEILNNFRAKLRRQMTSSNRNPKQQANERWRDISQQYQNI